ncbi:MAG: YtxH domain-containing protein [Nannocystaceae bacterium]|nr:YtxH domain-containing protein [bacterium]
MNTNDILRQFGLETRKTAKDFALPAIGVLGAGAAIGAGLTLLFAPKSGKAIRSDIKDAAAGLKDKAVTVKDGLTSRFSRAIDPEEMTRDDLYDEARARDIPGRSEMTKQELLEAVKAS